MWYSFTLSVLCAYSLAICLYADFLTLYYDEQIGACCDF